MITTVLVAYNEHDMLPHQLQNAWNYSDRIIVYDNCSTDDTARIARNAGCHVIEFDTAGQVRDDVLTEILNNAHHHVTEGWIFTHAVDEFIVAPGSTVFATFREYDRLGYNAILATGWNMVGDGTPFVGLLTAAIRTGVRAEEHFDKLVGYRKGVTPGYRVGCHSAVPSGATVVYAPTGEIYLLHYKFGLGLERIERRNNALVLSEINIRNEWAWHVKKPGHARAEFEYLTANAVEVF